MRVAVIFHRFGPYHCARLEAAARELEVIAIEIAAETSEYAWSKVKASQSYNRVTLCGEDESQERNTKEVTTLMRSALLDYHPDAVAIPGWSNKGAFAALRWCGETATPAILMSESTAEDEPRVRWREGIKRRVVKLYSSALVGGQRQVDYLRALGMPRENIFKGYDAVDNAFFAQGAKKARGQRSEVRDQYGLPANYFLASARFIEKKNLFKLLRAYAKYRRQAEVGFQRSAVRGPRSGVWHLVLLGDGPLRESLNSQLSTLNLHDHVHLPGFKQSDELPIYYGLAKTFVHASTTEQWGLVVNEAMASGLPVIVSNRCGCVPELVREGVNGFTFNPYNEEELTMRLLAMSALSDPERHAFGQVSEKIIAEHDVDRFASGLKKAAELAISLPRKRAGIVDRALLWALMRK